MRISISGSQCSGKTTTLNVLKEDEFFSGYEFDLESKTREVAVSIALSKNECENLLTSVLKSV
jgi:hypothetical protein